MPQASQAQQSSIPSSAPAPISASMSPPPAATSPTSYPTAPSYPQATAPAVDPWQEAYQRLSASLSGTQQSQPQAQPWQATQSAPAYPAYSPSPATSPQAAFSSAMPTSLPQAMPAYSPTSPTAWQNQANPYAAASAPAADGYLGSVSDESLEVLNHFGAEAPALLNRYACTVEDALLTQAQQSTQALEQLQQLSQNFQELELALNATLEDNQAYNLLTTDPDLLADYVNEFFGPDGPAPVELESDRLRADVAAAGYEPTGSMGAPYQRPQLEIPAPGTQQGASGDFWSTFDEVARKQPDQLWRVLSQATPDVIRSKPLISEAPPF